MSVRPESYQELIQKIYEKPNLNVIVNVIENQINNGKTYEQLMKSLNDRILLSKEGDFGIDYPDKYAEFGKLSLIDRVNLLDLYEKHTEAIKDFLDERFSRNRFLEKVQGSKQNLDEIKEQIKEIYDCNPYLKEWDQYRDIFYHRKKMYHLRIQQNKIQEADADKDMLEEFPHFYPDDYLKYENLRLEIKTLRKNMEDIFKRDLYDKNSDFSKYIDSLYDEYLQIRSLYESQNKEEKEKIKELSKILDLKVLPLWREYVYEIVPLSHKDQELESATKEFLELRSKVYGENWKPQKNRTDFSHSDVYQMFALKEYANCSREESEQEKKFITLLDFRSGGRNEPSYYLEGRLKAINQLSDYEEYLFGKNGKQSYFNYLDHIQELKQNPPTKENYQTYAKEVLYFQNNEGFNDRIYTREGFNEFEMWMKRQGFIFSEEPGNLKDIQCNQVVRKARKEYLEIYLERQKQLREIEKELTIDDKKSTSKRKQR